MWAEARPRRTRRRRSPRCLVASYTSPRSPALGVRVAPRIRGSPPSGRRRVHSVKPGFGLCSMMNSSAEDIRHRRRGTTMRDSAGATILVTGATDGLGKRVALELAERDATVLLHGRDLERGEAALDEIRRETGSEKLSLYLADFSSLGAVRELAEQVLAENERLDVLINNAGVIARERRKSDNGYELTF